jgi:hypothetical protein
MHVMPMPSQMRADAVSFTFSTRNLALSAAFSLALNFVFMLRGLLGPRVLTSLVTGRYNRWQMRS